MASVRINLEFISFDIITDRNKLCTIWSTTGLQIKKNVTNCAVLIETWLTSLGSLGDFVWHTHGCLRKLICPGIQIGHYYSDMAASKWWRLFQWVYLWRVRENPAVHRIINATVTPPPRPRPRPRNSQMHTLLEGCYSPGGVLLLGQDQDHRLVRPNICMCSPNLGHMAMTAKLPDKEGEFLYLCSGLQLTLQHWPMRERVLLMEKNGSCLAENVYPGDYS